MTFILSVDPGKMTGVALFAERTADSVGPVLLKTDELTRDDLEKWLEFHLLDPLQEPGNVEVVAERYKIGDADAPWSLQMLGVLSYLSRKGGHSEPTLQTPADAKGFATNEMLQGLGYWHVGGAGHANDAIRHGVLYMVRKNNTMKKLAARAVLDS